MAGKSFYDLDYIIEINEQRFGQYMSAYNELMGKLTNIVLIYSAVAIFLIPVVRNVFWAGAGNWVLNVSFVVFAVLFGISIFYTVRLILPKSLFHLEMPKRIYNESRAKYEQITDDRTTLEYYLKITYIIELEDSLKLNKENFVRKSNFYSNALIFALLSLLPYLICFWFFVSNERDKSLKGAEVVKTKIF